MPTSQHPTIYLTHYRLSATLRHPPTPSAQGITMSLPSDTEPPLDFDDFERRYNYGPEFRYNAPFFRIVRTLIQKKGSSATVLDIGCGEGIGRNKPMQHELRKVAGQYWGVEPDGEVEIEPGLFDRVERDLLEDAKLPENSVDVAYSFMVMEHVMDPDGFLKEIERVLKPGGVFVFATPNKHHMFGFCAYWADKLGIADFILGLIHKKDTLEHHYPLAYKINTAKQIRARAAAAGLDVRIGYCESTSSLRNYLKGPLNVFRWCLGAKREVWKQRSALCHIYGYLQKPGVAPQ